MQFARCSIYNKLGKIKLLDKTIRIFKGLKQQPIQEHKNNGNS